MVKLEGFANTPPPSPPPPSSPPPSSPPPSPPPNLKIEEQVIYLEAPDKSIVDKTVLKNVILGNGLRAVLVSDPTPLPHDGLTSSSSNSDAEGSGGDNADRKTSNDGKSDDESSESASDDGDRETEDKEKFAACAVLVSAGTFDDPRVYPGLAHLTEHMMFMGSVKHPGADDYDNHLKECRAFDNASTEGEDTVFYFGAPEKHFESCVEYMTDLLKGPLLLRETIDRQRKVIDSEFRETVTDNEAKRDQLLASLANVNYPHNSFSWGNAKSLKTHVNDDLLYQELRAFQERYYVANNMFVCLQARLPIDELEGLLVKHFGDLPKKDLPYKDISKYDYRDAFREEFYREVLFIIPIGNCFKVELSWVLPPMRKLYRCKPDQFFSYLLAHESKGTLCAYLRDKFWAVEIYAGVDYTGFDTNSFYSLFNISILMTRCGFDNLDSVIAAVFAYIKMISQHAELLKDLYDELQTIEKANFNYNYHKDAYENVQDLVANAKYYPPKDLITGSQLFLEYNEDDIKLVLKHLLHFKFNVSVTSHIKYDGVTYDKVEPWFNTKYGTIPMPIKWVKFWENSQELSESFHLPQPNRFVSADFRIWWEECGKPDMPMAPKKLLQTETCELWFRQDDKFQLPDAHMNFYFMSPLMRMNAKNDAQCIMLVQWIKFCLIEQLYQASIAGLEYQLDADDRGIMLKVNGYNHKLYEVVNHIVDLIVMEQIPSDDQFRILKIQLKKALFGAIVKPQTLNKDIRRSIVENIHFPLIDKYDAMDGITMNDFQEFWKKFTSQLYVKALMQGNLTEEMAHNVMNTVLTKLNCEPIIDTKFLENRVVQLPEGATYISCNNPDKMNSTSITCNFYQMGPYTLRTETLLDLLLMLVEKPLRDIVRDSELHEAHVYTSLRLINGISAYSLTVRYRKDRLNPIFVDKRIEVFRVKMIQTLAEMSDDDFEYAKETMIRLKEVPAKSLLEEITSNWEEIVNQEYIFQRNLKSANLLRTITKDELIDFCLTTEVNNTRKLSVEVLSDTNNEPDESSESAEEEDQSSKDDEYTDETTDSDENDDDDTDTTMELDPDEPFNDEIFDKMEHKLKIVFLRRSLLMTYITDINQFKRDLHVYPVMKTMDDTPPAVADEQPASIAPTAEIKDINN